MSDEPFTNKEPGSAANQTEAVLEEPQVEIVPSDEEGANEVVLTEADIKANKIIKNHVLCAMGAGLIPIPLVDIASVTAIQVDALKGLAEVHGVDSSDGNVKAIVTGLAGSTLARLGASAVKLVPGVGTAVGGLTMAGLSAASTYAICQVAQNHFKTRGTFLDLNMTDAKEAYAIALDKGKEIVKTLEDKKDQAVAKFEEIQQLQKEKAEGKISEQEYSDKQKDIMSEDKDDSAL